MTFDEQMLEAGKAGADGICGLCGFTYTGPRPIACSGCGQVGQSLELVERSERAVTTYDEQIPERYAESLWVKAHKVIIEAARSLSKTDKTGDAAVAAELWSLVSTDTSPLIVLFRNSSTLYDMLDVAADIIGTQLEAADNVEVEVDLKKGLDCPT